MRPILLALMLVSSARCAELPLDERAVASAGLRWEPLTGRLAPSAPDEVATLMWRFRTTADDPCLRLQTIVTRGGAGDAVRWSVAIEGGPWTDVALWTWQSGPRELDLSAWLPARGHTAALRLSLTSPRPGPLALRGLHGYLSGVEVLAPQGAWLPRGAWLYPAFAALRDGRDAAGVWPLPPVEEGQARTLSRPVADWKPLEDGGWRAADWSAGPLDPRDVRLLRAAPGPHGGRLLVDGRELAASDLPAMPFGARLGATGASLEVQGAAPLVEVLDVGRLELRYVRPRAAFDGADCRLWLEAVVINHDADPVAGTLSGFLDGRDEEAPTHATASYVFPPGPSLAPLVLQAGTVTRWDVGRPVTRRVRLAVDDGVRRTDVAELKVGLKESGWQGGPWLNGRRLRLAPRGAAGVSSQECRVIEAPADEAALAAADAAGAPLVIMVDAARPELLESERLLHGARPAVVAVVVDGAT
jgi:hypothetical protein